MLIKLYCYCKNFLCILREVITIIITIFFRMNIEQAKERIIIIKKELLLLNKAYFTDDTEIVPESVRDSLKRELILLETKYPQLLTSDSPSQIIGSELHKKFEKISHLQKKESLSDVFSYQEIEEWQDRIFRILPENFKYFCELKLDGLNITLRYKEGVLIQALTRGNGMEGENVTHTVKTISTIPHTLKTNFSGEKRKLPKPPPSTTPSSDPPPSFQ